MLLLYSFMKWIAGKLGASKGSARRIAAILLGVFALFVALGQKDLIASILYLFAAGFWIFMDIVRDLTGK